MRGSVSCMVPRFGRFAAAAVVMAMKSSAAAGSRLTTDGRSVLIKRPELLTTAVASEGSRFEAIVAPASWNTGSVLDHVNSDQFVPFLRALIATAEEDFGLSNYHLRFCAHSQYDRAPARGHKLGLAKLEGECLAAAERSGCYVVLAGDRLPAREVPRAPSLEALDCPIEYTDDSGKAVSLPVCQRDIMVREGEHCHVFLDAQSRPMYVSVLKGRFVRRQADLSDGELAELWRLPLAEAFASHASGFVDARINAGSSQNVAHVHLKVWLHEDEFTARWAGSAAYQALRQASRERKAARASAAGAGATSVHPDARAVT